MADYPALDLRIWPGPDSERVEALLYAALDDLQPIALQEHDSADGWLVFFRTDAARDAAATALAAFGDDLRSVTSLAVPDDDWARRSQANLTAITVGRITVAPPWDPVVAGTASAEPGILEPAPISDPRALVLDPRSLVPDPVKHPILIIIDPSMGFGTGHHQTTRLCLSMLQAVEVSGRRVIDVGTGSGVLAIAAWRLGAHSVVALDHDADAIQNARENIERNDAARAVDARCEDLSAFAADSADIVIANLTAAVIGHHAAALRQLVKPGGLLIVSGFSPQELQDVTTVFGVCASASEVEGEWAAAMIRL